MPPRGTIFVPSFAHGAWPTGVNDRFAYGERDTMLAAYTSQLDLAESGHADSLGAMPRTPLRLFDGEQSLCAQLHARGVTVASSTTQTLRRPTPTPTLTLTLTLTPTPTPNLTLTRSAFYPPTPRRARGGASSSCAALCASGSHTSSGSRGTVTPRSPTASVRSDSRGPTARDPYPFPSP